MSKIKLYTGEHLQDDQIDIEWYDENNLANMTQINILVKGKELPRTLYIKINGYTVFETQYDFKSKKPIASLYLSEEALLSLIQENIKNTLKPISWYTIADKPDWYDRISTFIAPSIVKIIFQNKEMTK